eukprot:CAMPEP_0172605298 /NCGR_PEP_ID=MMETSP1068-20121228/25534_1 /TAXON_ID=35684 /ORGANISM="Pseudopedinella elastica, Strain CCMP716" /LENGTH=47 /DNA_ID= /DNA_START= /DNA_END= /DNA_ORIENTATION=
MSKRAEAKPAVDDLLAVDAGEEGGPADPHGLSARFESQGVFEPAPVA